MKYDSELIRKENFRIVEEYRRRAVSIDQDLYAPWQPAENLMVSERKRVAAALLHKLGKFPKRGGQCLEIGYGRLGWLADLISWGLNETDLYGIELDSARAAFAKQALPSANLEIGDATELPWENETFDLIIISTVFSSILDKQIRKLIAGEATRVLRSGGAMIWYDLAVNNPKNSNVKGIIRKELKQLFPMLSVTTKQVTLAAPIARLVTPKSFSLASILSTMPFLRTHLIGLGIKPE